MKMNMVIIFAICSSPLVLTGGGDSEPLFHDDFESGHKINYIRADSTSNILQIDDSRWTGDPYGDSPSDVAITEGIGDNQMDFGKGGAYRNDLLVEKDVAFIRGDVVADGYHSIHDVLRILSFLCLEGPIPPCLDAADVTDNGVINLIDATRLLYWLFGVGPYPPLPPCCAIPESCGVDPTPDDLTCGAYPLCGPSAKSVVKPISTHQTEKSPEAIRQEDRLIVVCDNPYPVDTIIHVPVYAWVNARPGPPDTGLTGITLMFHNDHPGLYIDSIEWSGTSLGEAPTAIETYIGSPLAWCNQQCEDNCRGVAALFGSYPSVSIPSGYHLLCWLVVATHGPGSYVLEPADGYGEPPLKNLFAYGLVGNELLPEAFEGCTVVVSPFIRGDVQSDGDHDIFDALYLLNWLGGVNPEPSCVNAADVQDDEDTDIFDALYLLNWLGGINPPPPAPCCAIPDSCGSDPTPGALNCGSYSPCLP